MDQKGVQMNNRSVEILRELNRELEEHLAVGKALARSVEVCTLIKFATDINFSNRSKWLYEEQMNPEVYAREFKTIHINTGRRSGKTSAIFALGGRRDLVIVHNKATEDRLKNDYPAFRGKISALSTFITSFEVVQRIENFDRVWIDEPSLVNQNHTLSEIYRKTVADLYIKLGP